MVRDSEKMQIIMTRTFGLFSHSSGAQEDIFGNWIRLTSSSLHYPFAAGCVLPGFDEQVVSITSLNIFSIRRITLETSATWALISTLHSVRLILMVVLWAELRYSFLENGVGI